MKEINRTRLTQAVQSKVCSHSMIFWPLAMLVCLISVLTGISFLFEDNLSVRAAPQEQTSVEKLPPVMNLLPSAGFDLLLAKSSQPEDHVWREHAQVGRENPRIDFVKGAADIAAQPEPYRTLHLNESAQREVLRHAPMEFSKASRQNRVVMTLPMPDGTLARFRVEESPVMATELAARFPAIKTYRGRGLDDPTATTRFDVTPAGFHAIVLSQRGTVIIEPAAHGPAGKYVSYDQRDAAQDESSSSCVLLGAEQAALTKLESKQLARSSSANSNTATGSKLRTYRLALAATAEFTQTYGGGTVAGALSTMTTMVNAVNAIYERDLTIHLTLIANETSIIFTNSATDGYTSNSSTTLINQNQTVLDQRIGSANYDVGMVLDGHVFGTVPGFVVQGAGQPQSVCSSSQKGKGVSIFRSTDPTSIHGIYTVAHELGHMLGALHTFNSTADECGPSRFAQAAYEPGSGSTIMAYRGAFLPNGNYWPLCTAADELHSSDTYFHAASIEQIVNYTTFGNGSVCPAMTDTGNNPPSIDAGADYTIPANTPFALTATASDAEADALTYCWEEYDLGAPGPPHTDNGNRPIFRSFAPVASPARTFPQLPDILSGTPTFGESLPTTTRTMNFRITVRDNHSGSGGVNTGQMQVNVVSGAPFAVTAPGSSTTWTASSNQIVTWDVAATASPPVSCTNVRVLLSVDGGNSFPFTLAASVPNNGAATVNVPNTPTSTARIKVEAIGNIFFSISLPNFTITPNNTLPPTLLTEANTNRAVALDSVTFMRDLFPVATEHNFSLDLRTRVTLFAIGLELAAGEDISVITAQAEDSAHRIFPLTIEYVGKVPNLDWLTQFSVRLPDGLSTTGDLLVSVSLRGAVSNKAVIGIR
ncbi:MAG TPA: M12 family metallo-peptidase [Pyrinomonadaceae bacterium]|nr:M12 family metallo-peptidase [Pyrinomonadaceae bacterium]